MRNADELIARQGLPSPRVYADKAVWGTRADRPQFNQLMADIEAGQIKVLVVDDLTCLSRSEDMPTLIARLKFMGVHVISVDGFNSESEDAPLQTWVRGMMGNIYLDDLAKKTHRGLKGRVLSGHSAGGQAFGYRSEPVYEGKSIIGYQRRVVETEAEVIRQIFSLYADGWSARRIAEELNRRGVASPRGTSWVFTAIQGHAKNKSGILHMRRISAGRYGINPNGSKTPSPGSASASIDPKASGPSMKMRRCGSCRMTYGNG